MHMSPIFSSRVTYVKSIKVNFNAWIKPKPITLLVLPIIPSKTSQNFYSLFLYYSHAIIYYSYFILLRLIIISTVHLVADNYISCNI